MIFLQELVRVSRVSDEDGQVGPIDDSVSSFDNDSIEYDDPPEDDLDLSDAPSDDDRGIDGPPEDDPVEAEDDPVEAEDPNRQGLIRTVNKARLVYKRQTEEGTYEELWMYNTTSIRDEISIRKAILSGTDIPVTRTLSPDGGQEYETWTAGNVEMMLIRGLQQ